MNPAHERLHLLSHRHFFKSTNLTTEQIALTGLMFPKMLRTTAETQSTVPTHPTLPNLPHFAPKTKRLIYLFINNKPSQINLLNYKPSLERIYDTNLPDSIHIN